MLHNYGIQNEESDLRAHVSVCNATVYTFSPRAAMDAINNHPEVEARPAYQPGINFPTANGYPMPIKYIHDIKIVKIPDDIFTVAGFTTTREDTSTKGIRAVFCVKEMLVRKLIPFTFDIEEITDKTMQISGTDVLITTQYRIQIKCDWRVGETGNIYLQTHECNPFQKI